jgi:dihydropteroate synthase
VVAEVRGYVTAEAERAVAAGVRPDGIVIDPAHDFGKNTWQSLQLTRRTGDLVATGWPVLVAVSNKDFVGETLDLPVQERAEGTLAALAVCAWEGARLFRVHDVPAARDALAAVAALRTSEEVAALRSARAAGSGAGAAGDGAGPLGAAGTRGSGRPRR